MEWVCEELGEDLWGDLPPLYIPKTPLKPDVSSYLGALSSYVGRAKELWSEQRRAIVSRGARCSRSIASVYREGTNIGLNFVRPKRIQPNPSPKLISAIIYSSVKKVCV